VEYLDKLTSDAAGDPNLQRELAWGYQRLAVIQGNATESNLGKLDAALASNRKTLQLFESVAHANPTDTIDQLNVAMMHRILSFSEIMEGGGRDELEKAMAITDRLIKTDSQNPKVKSERSIEYQNLALLYDGMGDQRRALEAYQKNVALREDIFRTAPDYHGIRRSLGMVTAQLGMELARAGRRKEALEILNKSIARFDEASKNGGTPDVAREGAVAKTKKAEVQMMDGDVTGALQSLQEASQTIQPLAKEDPENSMLSADLAGLEYRKGVLLMLQRKYGEAAPIFQAAYKQYAASGASADVPPGKAAFLNWMGEAEMRQKKSGAALQDFEQVIKELTVGPGKPLHDDYRCQLAESHVKAGRVLLQIGKNQEAEAEFKKALEVSEPSLKDELQDVPEYYVAADGYAGLGDAAMADAHSAKTGKGRKQKLELARDAYAKSMEFWQKIPNPTALSPSLFLVKSEPEVAKDFSRCKEELNNLN